MSLAEEKPPGYLLNINLINYMWKVSNNRFFDVILIYANITRRDDISLTNIRRGRCRDSREELGDKKTLKIIYYLSNIN